MQLLVLQFLMCSFWNFYCKLAFYFDLSMLVDGTWMNHSTHSVSPSEIFDSYFHDCLRVQIHDIFCNYFLLIRDAGLAHPGFRTLSFDESFLYAVSFVL